MNFYNNPYYGGSYSNPYMQPQPQVQPQTPPTQQLRPSAIQYATEQEIASYIVSYGEKIMAFDPKEKIFYIKYLDGTGKPVFEKYTYAEFMPQTVQTPGSNYVSKEELSGYVPISNFKALADRMAKLENALKGTALPKQGG